MQTMFLHFLLFLITTSVTNLIPAVHSSSIESQKQSLLHFKRSLVFNSSFSSKLVTWNSGTDCCSWVGVTCGSDRRVVGLDLSSESISCSIDSSSSLFQLEHLQSLNLADNFFNYSSIPSAIGKLADLRYLNLSYGYFSGQIPIEVAGLTKLVTLDLSYQIYSSFEVENPNLGMLFQNLTELRELYFVLPAQGSDWCEAISSSLPNLRVLSLFGCGLRGPRGPLCESLANLQSLYHIDLSYNSFNSPVPRAWANLSNLTYLNLFRSELLGTFPKEIFQIPSLQTIDLSNNHDLHGSFPEFPNNGSLRSLIVDSTSFSGELPKSIENLTQLVDLDVSWNKLNSRITSIHWENLVNLEILSLGANQFYGPIPSSLFSPSKLESLELFENRFSGQVPEFSSNSSKLLHTLILGNNNLQGQIPASIFNLQGLAHLDLSSNNFSGFPFDGLNHQPRNLSSVYLSYNSLLFNNHSSNSSSLKIDTLFLGSNKLGAFPEFLRDQNTLDISSLDLSGNQIQGEIPNWIFSLRSLTSLDLSFNSLVTVEPLLPNSTSVLKDLQISSNKLQDIHSTYSFLQLRSLDLSSNRLKAFPNFLRNQSQLISLFLYSNKLEDIPSSYSFPQLQQLDLASNKLKAFPDFLRNGSNHLMTLDLSDNQIQGQIPNWIWRLLSLGYPRQLNLSCNSLETLEAPPPNSTYVVEVLDLHSNQLQGQIPLFLGGGVIDYSRNNFNTTIPDVIGDFVSAEIFSVSSNNLHGAIPKSICNISASVLDLSNNSLSGEIPRCLAEDGKLSVLDLSGKLSVLDLSRNKLTGNVPDHFQKGCGLQTLDLNRNQIQGQFPKSLVNCSALVFLNLGNNNITDPFPCGVMNISTLRVLVLRSNKFYGSIGCSSTYDTWSVLQVIDLARNNFSGDLAGRMFLKWQVMVSNEDDSATTNLAYGDTQLWMTTRNEELADYYRDAITTVIKGLELDLDKILTTFTLIDFSSNKFTGSIPEEIGELKSLHVLNLSGNALTGKIPSSFGQMRQLESLDLANNHLSGQIPTQMAKDLTFLAFLNLSNNELVGKIPTGPQFSTFQNTSFLGNQGLWGPPLTTDTLLPPSTANGSSSPPNGNEIDWTIISVEIGFTCGFGLAVGSLLFCKRWRKWYYAAMRSVFFKIFPQLEERLGIHRRHVSMGTRL